MGKKILKGKKLDKGLGIKPEDWGRAVAVPYVIDTNLRGKNGATGKEPRMKK